MPVVQEALYIPDSISTKILTGEYIRIGGAVRHAIGPNKGRIVKLLEPVDFKVPQEAQDVAEKVLQFTNNNKKALILAGIGTGIVVAGTGIYYKIKNKEPLILKEFKSVFKEYLNAIRDAKLSEDIIDTMLLSLENLKEHKDYKKFQIQLSAEELDTIVCKVFEYTKKLVADNDLKLDGNEKLDHMSDSDIIIALERYLNLQKHIFSAAA